MSDLSASRAYRDAIVSKDWLSVMPCVTDEGAVWITAITGDEGYEAICLDLENAKALRDHLSALIDAAGAS